MFLTSVFLQISLLGGLPFSNETTSFSFQNSTNALQKYAVLHLPLQCSVVSIEKKQWEDYFHCDILSCLSVDHVPFSQWLMNGFKTRKTCILIFCLSRNLRKLQYCHCLQCPYLSITASKDSDKETLLSSCLSKIHEQQE